VPLVPHSDELGALACAMAGTTRVLWTGVALPTLLRPLTFTIGIQAPASQLQSRRRLLPALRTRRSTVNPNTQSGHIHARIRSGGVHAQNVYRLTRSDDSHRQRVPILT
jgi:hypothetical protein